MKKVIVFVLIAIALVMAMGHLNTYEMQGTITNRNEITDRAGHIWEYDTDGYRVGDNVIITFNNKDTNTRTDDIIKGIK